MFVQFVKLLYTPSVLTVIPSSWLGGTYCSHFTEVETEVVNFIHSPTALPGWDQGWVPDFLTFINWECPSSENKISLIIFLMHHFFFISAIGDFLIFLSLLPFFLA